MNDYIVKVTNIMTHSNLCCLHAADQWIDSTEYEEKINMRCYSVMTVISVTH